MLRIFQRVGRKLARTFGRRRCNLCGWRGGEFASDSWHPQTICPHCGSQVRHRLMVACFQSLPEWSLQTLFARKRVLHFAPEPAIRRLVQPLAADYLTADFLDDACDLKIDMCRMEGLEACSMDTIVACDVLEHVPDDLRAIRELWRVLSPQGTAILTVPQGNGMAVKLELPADASAADRLRLAGQEDHQRIYGADFPHLLRQAGFEVTPVDESNFTAGFVSQHGLRPPVLSSHPLATNYRRIYFARKAE